MFHYIGSDQVIEDVLGRVVCRSLDVTRAHRLASGGVAGTKAFVYAVVSRASGSSGDSFRFIDTLSVGGVSDDGTLCGLA